MLLERIQRASACLNSYGTRKLFVQTLRTYLYHFVEAVIFSFTYFHPHNISASNNCQWKTGRSPNQSHRPSLTFKTSIMSTRTTCLTTEAKSLWSIYLVWRHVIGALKRLLVTTNGRCRSVALMVPSSTWKVMQPHFRISNVFKLLFFLAASVLEAVYETETKCDLSERDTVTTVIDFKCPRDHNSTLEVNAAFTSPA